jgi:hypothetical protein
MLLTTYIIFPQIAYSIYHDIHVKNVVIHINIKQIFVDMKFMNVVLKKCSFVIFVKEDFIKSPI